LDHLKIPAGQLPTIHAKLEMVMPGMVEDHISHVSPYIDNAWIAVAEKDVRSYSEASLNPQG
jgi:hypothetical protein